MFEPAESGADDRHRVVIGKVGGIYGVAGWLKILSYTRPRENIFEYRQWLLGHDSDWDQVELSDGKRQGKGLIAKLAGLDDRDEARAYLGKDIAIYREQLPALPEGKFYWCDLMGLEVINQGGVRLGQVTGVHETGANDVLIVTGEHRYLIPLVMEHYVMDIDPESKRILVDWDPGYL